MSEGAFLPQILAIAEVEPLLSKGPVFLCFPIRFFNFLPGVTGSQSVQNDYYDYMYIEKREKFRVHMFTFSLSNPSATP